ncbi:FAD/NAD(P)-binding protein [Amycolatopsis sp. K13G38]|uniref:FAD/NAD(P)-binding protein n=1 Tax=Amycolatopsis acididurans TaxID=2724524 RepID=A0ABX1JBV7_9PSEU|nr:FAD/NAD(P)-binding protein [Amycolatopsis acididurans]NKQ55906.1 FAD/NAD(P)-binding protein [Amycolatopsis acididurans]
MPPLQLAIVGAGPRGVCVLERISANAALLGGRALVVHLIDPFPPGAGRIWRYEQSPLLRMNSMAEDVTMFTDETVRIEGPIRPGPSLWEWAEQVRAGEIRAHVADDLRDELTTMASTSFPTRRLASAYLAWVYRTVLDDLPGEITVIEHRARAASIDGQRVRLEGGELIDADALLLTVGHLDAEPDAGEARIAEFAARHGLAYYPAGYTADVDYDAVAPGEDVLVRGFGLAFVDLMLLLTEGRGGRFAERADGLVYQPSGREPVLHVGSRRGVPYHSKPGYRLQGEPLRLPRFFDRAAIENLPEYGDFFADVWPLIAKELTWGYYAELFTGHPGRVRLGFEEFAKRFAELPWDGDEMRALIERSVPAAEDRLDLRRLDRPLEGVSFGSREEFAKHLREYVEADLARRADVAYSADLGAFMAMLSVIGQLPALVTARRIDPASQVSDLDRWWHGFFSYFASGPPPRRLHELLALEEAGIVSFLGAEMRVELDHDRFVGSGASFPGSVEARTLIEARLPEASVPRASDGFVRFLRDSGDIADETVRGVASGRIHTRPSDSRLLDANGMAHPRRFSLGPHTSARSTAAFTRPRMNALPFRQNDAVAREILTTLSNG